MKPHLRSFVAALVTLFLLALGGVLAWRGAGTAGFMPHAHCYLFNPQLMLLHGGSDLLIGLAYVAISVTLTYVVFRARGDLPFHWMMLAFALFIVACGGTHFMELWTLRAAHPPYWMAGWMKLITAAASVVTALLLPPLVPRLLALFRSSHDLERRQHSLEKAYAEIKAMHDQTTRRAPRKESLLAAGYIPEHPTEKDVATLARQVAEHAREAEHARQLAEDANRAKDQFLAVLSHELRTPLTPALAAAENLELAEDLDPREIRESIVLIRRNIEIEARLVDDLLDLTRINRGKLRVHSSTVNLHETIQHAAGMCQSAALGKRINLAITLDATNYHVLGDGARLTQVLWNLLLNAVKFTPAEGEITIVSSNPQTDRVRVVVSDNGMGIDPAELTRIFEPFQQGKESTTRSHGGLGLGLTVAKGLMDAHDGTIVAASEGRDRGSTLTLELATTVPPVAPRISGAQTSPPVTARLRILLAEDHEDTRKALERLLVRWGHEVRTAATVSDAVRLADEYQPDLLMSDIGLPDGTGIDILSQILSRQPMKAIAMSGYGMESDLEKTRQAGFREHLVKPVSAALLKEAIERMMTK